MGEHALPACSTPARLSMRLALLTATFVATFPGAAFATEPALRTTSPGAVVELVEHGSGLFQVQQLRVPDFDEAIANPLRLTLPSTLAPQRMARDVGFLFSPDLPLAGTALTLRLVPTRRAPSTDEPLVLLPRVAGVGSKWFGLDFAAWF